MSRENLTQSLWAIADGIRYVPGALRSSVPLFRGGSTDKGAYFDFDIYVRDPGYLESVAHWYISAIRSIKELAKAEGKPGPKVLAYVHKNYADDAVTVGMAPLVGLIATHPTVRLPQVAVRLDRELPHDQVKLGGPGTTETVIEDVEVVLMTDHVSGGEELLKAILALKRYGAKVNYAITFSIWLDKFDAGFGQSVNAETTLYYLNSLERETVDGVEYAIPKPNDELIEKINQVLDGPEPVVA